MTAETPVVSDAGPLHYLLLIGSIGILPALFDDILVPARVVEELQRPQAPEALRRWLKNAPPWLKVAATPAGERFRGRDLGEESAIALALSVKAGLLLIDDRAGKRRARAQGLVTTGTIGVLANASQLGLLDLQDAFARLRRTNFRYSPGLLEATLARLMP